MFAYCGNNPVTRADSSGYGWFDVLVIGLFAMAAVALLVVAAPIVAAGIAFVAPALAAVAPVIAYGGAAVIGTGITLAAAADANEAVGGGNAFKELMGEENYQTAKTVLNLAVFAFAAFAAATEPYTRPQTAACFIAGTPVAAEDGYKPIEQIKEGDRVYAEDPGTGEKGLRKVVRTFVSETSELVHIHVDGEEITATAEHPFYVPQKGWTAAVRLRAGDILVRLNGEYAVVEKVEHELLESPVTVYNFEVEGFHTYYVSHSGLLVHNACDKPKSPVKVSESTIEKDHIDIHVLKNEFAGKGSISLFNIYRDKANSDMLWLGHGSIWINTGYTYNEIKIMYRK